MITPHKGGRSAILPGTRINPEVLDRLRAVCDALDLSVSDWVELHANADGERLEAVQAAGESPKPKAILHLGKVTADARTKEKAGA